MIGILLALIVRDVLQNAEGIRTFYKQQATNLIVKVGYNWEVIFGQREGDKTPAVARVIDKSRLVCYTRWLMACNEPWPERILRRDRKNGVPE
jgi:hypothetical protein